MRGFFGAVKYCRVWLMVMKHEDREIAKGTIDFSPPSSS